MKNLPNFFVIIFIILFCASCSTAQNPGGFVAPPTFPTALSPSENPTVSPTMTPTSSPTSAPIPTSEPGMPEILNLYIAENNTRTLVSNFSSNWTSGEDIDCFEAITSNQKTHTGKFSDIWNTAWNSYTNTSNVKIAYSIDIILKNGSNIFYDIKSPADAQQNRDYIEVYLYDDIHVEGFYSHLEETDMKDDTIITSIKLTATEKQAEIEKIRLTSYLYTPDMPERIIASHAIDIINESRANQGA